MHFLIWRYGTITQKRFAKSSFSLKAQKILKNNSAVFSSANLKFFSWSLFHFANDKCKLFFTILYLGNYDLYGNIWYRFINWILIGSFRFDLYRRWWWNRSSLGSWWVERRQRESHSVFSIEITKQRLEKILEENIKLVM